MKLTSRYPIFLSVLPILLSACSGGVAAANPPRPHKPHTHKRPPPGPPPGTPLTLQGRNFGDRTGKVAIGGKSVKVLSWSDDKVVVETPSHATTACASARVVNVEGDVSNAVPFAYGDRGVWLPNSEVPTAREYALSAWTGEEMIVWGGGSSAGGRYNPLTDSWLPMSTFGAPKPNFWLTGGTMLWTGKEILVWVGNEGGTRYDPYSDSWSPMSTKGEPDAFGGSAVWTGTEMIVWGYKGGARYDPETDLWHAISEKVPGDPVIEATLRRTFHSAVWTGSAMIIWGGHLDDTVLLATGGAIYRPSDNTWTPIPQVHGPSQRGFHQAAWTGTEMLIWGGTADMDTIPSEFGSVEASGSRYNPETNTWRPMSAAGMPTGAVGATSMWTGEEWIVLGGRLNELDSVPNEGGARYNPVTDEWFPLSVTGQAPGRVNATAVMIGEDMVVWGGADGEYVPTAGGGRYNPRRNRWTPIAGVTGEPSVRTGFTYLWTGTEMIVWGGLQNDGWEPTVADQGSRYNPATNEWLPMNEPLAPQGRAWHTSVWTGSQMVVFGGEQHHSSEASDPVTTAVAYRPATGEWSTLSSAGMPGSRSRGSAVWTGEKMIVWGGFPAAGPDSGAYEPALDRWTPLSTAGAPVLRQNAHMVWTGSEAIVYGGGGASYEVRYTNRGLSSGGRYNPETDSWKPMPSADFLEIGYDNTTLWTGKEYVIIGSHGIDFGYGGFTAQGGRYNPVSNRWTAMNITGAPIANRADAVWTGQEILVFSPPSVNGSYPGANTLKGFRYSVTDDSWASVRCGCGIAVGEFGASEMAISQKAVWTGSTVQIWGLYGGVTYSP